MIRATIVDLPDAGKPEIRSSGIRSEFEIKLR
jgi:hypothetical protein